jgi:hypothetical protein
MGQVNLFLSIASIGCAFIAIVMMSVYRGHHASLQLQQLIYSVQLVQANTQTITNSIAGTDSDLPGLILKNQTFNQCIVSGNNWCSNITNRYLNDLDNLTNVFTVDSLNSSLISTQSQCNERIDLLKMMILLFNTGSANLPVLLQNGNVNVNIGSDSVLALYEVYHLKLAQDELNIYYMVIRPWLITITPISLTNPNVLYQTFTPSISSCTNSTISLGRHKVLGVQSSQYSPTFMSGYGYEIFCNGDIVFETQGTLTMGETVEMTGNLMILIN